MTEMELVLTICRD